MKKRTKVIIFVVLGLIILAVAGFFIGKYYAVNYAFNKVFDEGITAMIDIAQTKEQPSGTGETSASAGGTAGNTQDPEDEASATDTPGTDGGTTNGSSPSGTGEGGSGSKSKPTAQKAPEEMTDREVINEVMKDSSLMSKMGGMVSYSDRERVIAIVLSNFTAQELSHYSALMAKGLDSATRSEIISTARSRLTSAQMAECMQIAYKYADQIRPYLKKN